MDIIFNSKGTPVAFQGSNFIGSTKSDFPYTKTKSVTSETDDTFKFQGKEYVSWGENNNYPDEAEKLIETTSVLKTGLNYKARCCYGQGVLPVTLEGFDKNNNEIFKPVQDKDVLGYASGLLFRNYHSFAFRDLLKFGNCFPLFVFNNKGDKIARTQIENARHCRMSKDKTRLLLYGKFSEGNPGSDGKDAIVYDMLDEQDPFGDLIWRRNTKKLKGSAIAFPRIKNYFSNNDYYATPDWESAHKSGWLEIAHKIPKFLNKAYENAMHLMWHVQIPADFWDNKFPEGEFNNIEDRENAIKDYMLEFEKRLTDVNNASKALFTHYYLDENGKKSGDWIITRMDSEIKAEERLTTSAAANSEILFSLMVNPSVLGAGMPGGPYSGNAGSGSDIREGMLVSLILSHIEKQSVLDPIETMLQFNGFENIDIKYKNIILTTLNTGRSTEENLT